MALVTDAEVKMIVDTQRDTTFAITAADLIITEDLASSGYSAARLKQIELYLAAHFVTLTEERGGLTGMKTGSASETYAHVDGEGYESTRYGKQALTFDINNVLPTGKTGAGFSMLSEVQT